MEFAILARTWLHLTFSSSSPSLVEQPELLPIALGWLLEQSPLCERCLDFVEVCAGSAVATRAVRDHALEAAALDILYHADQDLTLLIGLLLWGFHILCLRPGSVCHFCPKCSLWLVYLSRSVSGMGSSTPWGNEQHLSVQRANAVALAVSQLLVLAHLRSVFVLLEQPYGR